MSADKNFKMSTDKDKKLLYGDLTYRINGTLYKVHNYLGSIHKESVYQKAIAIELEDKKINFEKEKSIPIKYKNRNIGLYKPDF